MLEALDADAVRLWSRAVLDLLAEHSAEIDALNVFPVADSDTGTNTLTTWRGGDAALRSQPTSAAASASPADGAATALATLAGGAASAALGNSGFLLSQVLRGLAEALARADAGSDAGNVAAGLASGARLARAAVVSPVDGTILSVAEAAADAATRAAAGSPGIPGDLRATVLAAVHAADAALAQTTAQLPRLTEVGVVDAGGRALLVVLAALANVVTGSTVALAPVQLPADRTVGVGVRPGAVQRADARHDYGFEVQYALATDTPAVLEPLRARLDALGDSVAVVPTGPGTWKVHVHVDDVGAVIEAGVEAGRPSAISVARLAEPAGENAITAVLAVAPGAGLAHLFTAAGVDLVEGGADDLPEAADVVKAITATGAPEVVLLPNAARLSGVAEAAADLARAGGVRVVVVPTRSPVQGLAAAAVHDPARRFDDDVVAMAEAAAATRHAEIVLATDRALTAVGICEPGDALGLIDGEVVYVGRGVLAAAFVVVDRLLGVGAEMITVLVGDRAPARAGELVAAHVRGRAPLTDVHVYAGGQADVPLIIGVE